MNRKFLFRGKTITDNRFVYGDLIQYGKYTSIRANLAKDGETPNYCEFIVDSETVGQFTGLTDKNGKNIFEGDTIKVEPFIAPHFVSFGKSEKWGACFCSESKNSIIYLNKMYAESSEVTGNIHDNTELL